MTSTISIRGARTHNLANIDLDLPHRKLTTITGLSGSGKSSLAFDTIGAEGTRLYIEPLSPHIKYFLPSIEKPDVDHIQGLSPTITIQQKTTGHNPRSTVGTVTSVYDYLRVLFAGIGEPYCPTHRIKLAAQTVSQMADHILSLPENTRFSLLAPVLQKKKGEHKELIARLKREGYSRVRYNGQFTKLVDLPPLNPKQHHSLEVVVTHLIQQPDIRTRLVDALETALHLGKDTVKVSLPQNQADNAKKDLVFSASLACPDCDYNAPSLDPSLFSFNSVLGACPNCNGLGKKMPLFQPGVPHSWINGIVFFKGHQQGTAFDQIQSCESCQGSRLRLAARHVFIANTSLPELTQLPLDELQAFFSRLALEGQRKEIAENVLKEINSRLSFLLDVGVDYLNLARPAETLSGGEAQRIRLATQIGSGLTGVTYVLDEPSIGLHARDNARLLKTLQQLRDLGNTVIVVEHDIETMHRADYLVDIGPGAGVHGGHIVAQGTPQEVMQNDCSLTGQYLSKKRFITIPEKRTPFSADKILTLSNIEENNLQSVTVQFPLGLMTCVTGVSGSGKSTLVNQVLYPTVSCYLAMCQKEQSKQAIAGLESHIDKIIAIDQKPIGRTPRSNPATYVGVLDLIRELFAATPEARARGYKMGRFSFNVKGGRCNICEGAGLIKVEMQLLADVHTTCEACQGKRYSQETLEIKYKQKNIHEVLSMTVEAAVEFFQAVPLLTRKLNTLMEVGLSYITLGQSATTFSGGEAQRIKLAKELSRKDTKKTLYILDEPTTGLHLYDIDQLLTVLHTLRDRGNTIVIIEHNLDVIKTADWIIDLGPEGGKKGGKIIATGTPEAVAKERKSYTGQYLQSIFAEESTF